MMFYALGWLLVFGLMALWSLAAWALHAVTVWTVANAGVLAEGAGVTQGLRLPDWLAPWMPPEATAALEPVVSALVPALQAVLAWVPALESGLSVVVWVVWGVGCALLVVLGLVATGLIAVLRRRASAPVASSGSPVAAQ